MENNVSLEKTIESLKSNGMNVLVTENKGEVKELVATLLIEGSEVMQMTSITLEETGVASLINESSKYKAVRPMLSDPSQTGLSVKDKARLASVPDFAVGSVHAITEDGQLVIASATGSQLPAYAYGPGKVIFVVGIQKLVTNLDAALKRIYEYVLPLESERVHKAYGIPGSGVNKLLIINKERVADRITVIIVKESVGF